MAAFAKSVNEVEAKLAKLFTKEGRLRGLSFTPRPDDVFVTTSAKAGTTWVQQIVHQLRTRGSMDFEEITEVIPWVEAATDIGIDLEAEQVATPRAFKTHCWYDHCPKGGKYIVVMRNPRAVAPSLYKMLAGWWFLPSDIDVNTFVRSFWLARGKPQSKLENSSYWHFYASWWPHRHDSNVLWLFYEDMLEDHLGSVKKIATFINCGADDEELHQLVVKQSSLEFMKKHVVKYDDHLLKSKRNEAIDVPKDASGAAKVNEGNNEAYKAMLSPEVIQAIDDAWKLMEDATGFSCYEDLRKNSSFTK
ncbi:amine sulfotransferase-like [Corticium candelabrum]|uniref:amine sulfotransferase-like n=1 Tax=Corticium candelabrum TaxID=121492 RepID=UPI002E2553ED|nr:amine sulfotransferase-like [Corticium candelabrum]